MKKIPFYLVLSLLGVTLSACNGELKKDNPKDNNAGQNPVASPSPSPDPQAPGGTASLSIDFKDELWRTSVVGDNELKVSVTALQEDGVSIEGFAVQSSDESLVSATREEDAVILRPLAPGSASVTFSLDSNPDIKQEVRVLVESNWTMGPQAPRDIDNPTGTNRAKFGEAPSYQEMNLCNIHFHKNAEHKGGEFTTYAGDGDGKGYDSGYVYDGLLSEEEKAHSEEALCYGKKGGLKAGDTIEVHYVHSTADIQPGPTLGACLSKDNKNPQLRVEAQVFVLVNDSSAADFLTLTEHGELNGYRQALNIPENTGQPVLYAGSTTGPSYNHAGSPFQVTWSVRPEVMKVNIASVGKWCEGNVFNEDHAHGVRNLVTHPEMLSLME